MEELLTLGRDSLPRFLRRWYGPPVRDRRAARADLPAALREWHEVTSRWPAVTFHNGPVETEIEDGKLVFWEENQGCWVWAVDRTGDDPPVYDRQTSDDPRPWARTGQTLSQFLIHATVFEAICGAPHTATARSLTSAQLARVTAGLKPLPLPGWRWPEPGGQILVGSNVLADLMPADGLTIAARTSEALAPFTEMPGIGWRSLGGAGAADTEPIPEFLR